MFIAAQIDTGADISHLILLRAHCWCCFFIFGGDSHMIIEPVGVVGSSMLLTGFSCGLLVLLLVFRFFL